MTDTLTTHEKVQFEIKHTNVVKGVAMCLLLIHHLYMGVLPAPMSLTGNDALVVFATLSKVCVALFTLLSGYGLAVSYEKKLGDSHKLGLREDVQFTLSRYVKLMKQYWYIFLVFFCLMPFFYVEQQIPGGAISAIYGTGSQGVIAAVIDFLGLRVLFQTGTLNQTWWYMETTIVLHLCFVPMYHLTKRLPYIALPLTVIPLVILYLFYNNIWSGCREIFWFFPFAAGIFMAQRGLLDKFCGYARKRCVPAILISTAGLLVTTVFRAKIGVAFDTIFAISIVLFSAATLCRIPVFSPICAWMGTYSSSVFMQHSFFYAYFTWKTVIIEFLWSPSRPVQLLAFPVLLGMSLGCAVLMKAVSKGYRWAMHAVEGK